MEKFAAPKLSITLSVLIRNTCNSFFSRADSKSQWGFNYRICPMKVSSQSYVQILDSHSICMGDTRKWEQFDVIQNLNSKRQFSIFLWFKLFCSWRHVNHTYSHLIKRASSFACLVLLHCCWVRTENKKTPTSYTNWPHFSPQRKRNGLLMTWQWRAYS